MLRIECESCHAPYQVDERRVPPQGLKMRCPKCGHTFSVQNPGAPGVAPASAGPTAAAKVNPKMTMVGLGNVPKAPPLPPRPAPPAPARPVNAAPAPSPDLDLPAARAVPPRPGAPSPVVPPRPKPPPAPSVDLDLPSPREKHPSLPAAFGNVDDLLPAARAVKPSVASAASAAPAAPAAKPPPPVAGFGEIDLPAIASDLPARPAALPSAMKRSAAADDLELDLGPPAADLPAPLPDLPSLASSLPSKKAEPAFGEIDLPSLELNTNLPQVASALPSVASALPSVASALPQVAATLPQVANVLPAVGQQLPSLTNDARLPTVGSVSHDFGEVDLGPLSAPPPPRLEAQNVAKSSSPPNAFAELDLGDAELKSLPPSKPQPAAPPPVPPPMNVAKTQLGFGELDLGGQSTAPAIQTEASLPPPPAATGAGYGEEALPVSGRLSGAPSTEVSLPIQPGRRREREVAERPSRAPRIIFLIVVLLIAGGGSLQLTKHGAFGYLTIGDMLHEKDYKAFALAQSQAWRARASKDVFPEARGAVDDIMAAHWRMPRAGALTAYAAFAEFAYETRFGADVERNAKAKLFLAEVVARPEVPYVNVALAAQDAAAGNITQARKGLDAASKRDAGDPIQRDIALLRGEVELLAKDPVAAKTFFDLALKLGATAQAHYGLARTAMLQRDWALVATECDQAIAITPHHPGALLLRALERYNAKGDDTGALADLDEITTGAAKALASNTEVAQAFANRGRIFLSSGRAGDARSAFEASLKLDNRNVDALIGQGTVFYEESRFTEALTRFDTALAARPDDENAVALDALTKIKLERLKDAKDQLVAARAKFPRSMRISFALAQAERALGNIADAEKDLRQAIDFAAPKDPSSVEPYIGLATLLIAHNRDKDASDVIEEARARLPDAAPVAVAFGEYDAAQGKYEDAVAHFRHALDLSPNSLSTHFKLGVTYRHMRKTDLAAQEFDQVLALDKDYPGLALERGLLFEDSGEVDRALEQFKNALARAPDDPDLQLRVGAAYVAIGRPEEALTMLRKVLEKRGTSAEANHYLGRALFGKEGATNEAMRFLKRAVELDPNRAEYHLYVAWAANDANPAQLGLAQDEIDKALALDKLLADAYWQRGVLERKRLAVDDALKDLRHALDLKPTRIDAYATIAECYEDKNDPQNAIANWKKAIAGNAHNPFWRYRYGKLMLEHNSPAEAAASLTFAVDEAAKLENRPPWLPPAEFSAGEALNRSGRRQDAIAMYRRFLEVAPSNDPDRRDAIKALENLGEAYRPGGR